MSRAGGSLGRKVRRGGLHEEGDRGEVEVRR